ncbi:hypothetical protein [Spiroplasma endosymbiont of Polydrusus formosus]|uniref:hypothetical protein n=1 Tax=Spiroplasma endosymbiont of Polydrusus formosus TaxID=3139326 RepID=UPI0035B54860
MLIIIITLFEGVILSNNLSTSQLKLIGKDLYSTNITFQVNKNLKIVSSNQSLSYRLNNINYINNGGNLDLNKIDSSYFRLVNKEQYSYKITLD